MKVKYAVTFEFMVRQPITVRGEAEAGSIRTLAARAIDDAEQSDIDSHRNWSSISILLDRYDFMSKNEKKGIENENN